MAEISSAPSKASLAALVVSVAATIVAIGLRLRDLTTYGLWMDEVFSLRFARASWSGLLEQTAADAVHPPLFYFVLKIWLMIGGEPLLWLKILPLLFGIAAIAAIYFLALELSLSYTEFTIVLIFTSLNAYLIYYAQELRMYSMLMFFGVISIWAFVRFVNERGRYSWLVLPVVNLLLVYTHYFGWLTVAAEGIVVLILYRGKFKAFTLQCVGLLVAFLPWVLAVTAALSSAGRYNGNVKWIGKPPLAAVPVFIADLYGNFSGVRSTIGASLLVFIIPLAVWLWQSRRESRDRDLAVVLGILAAIPIAAAFLISQVSSTSVWVDRYLIVTAVPFIVLLSVAACRVRPRTLSTVLLSLMIAWALGAGAWNVAIRRDRLDWVTLSEVIAAKPADVYTLERWAAMPLEEATRRSAPDISVHSIPPSFDLPVGRFWLAFRESTWPEWRRPQPEACVLEEVHSDRSSNETVHLILLTCSAPDA